MGKRISSLFALLLLVLGMITVVTVGARAHGDRRVIPDAGPGVSCAVDAVAAASPGEDVLDEDEGSDDLDRIGLDLPSGILAFSVWKAPRVPIALVFDLSPVSVFGRYFSLPPPT